MLCTWFSRSAPKVPGTLPIKVVGVRPRVDTHQPSHKDPIWAVLDIKQIKR